MLYRTIARLGAYAPIIRADNAGQALRLIAYFQRLMASQSVECALGLAGVVAKDNAHFSLAWERDYANHGIDENKAGQKKPTGKVATKIDGFYSVTNAREKQTVTYTC